MEVVANQVVGVSNMQEAEFNYASRTGGVTVDQLERIDWDENVHFKCNKSDSRSFEIADLLDDDEGLALGWLFDLPTGEEENVFMVDFWGGEEYFLLQWLFNEQVDLFEEEEFDQTELEELIMNKKKISLYELFLRENKLPVPMSAKRKHSP